MDRHQLYQAFYSALAAAPLGNLEPLRASEQQDSMACNQAACVSDGGRGTLAGSSVNAVMDGAGQGTQNRQAARRLGGIRAGNEEAEQLPFDVLLAQTATLMLVEQVTYH